MQFMQMRQAIKEQMGITAGCFDECVQKFNDTTLSSGEKSCLQNCGTRYVGTMQLLMNAQTSLQARAGGMSSF